MDQFDFSGKKIIVTGASSGVGRETAVLLSQTGAKIVLLARREEELKRTLSMMEGDSHTYKVLDVSDFDSVVDSIKEIVAEDGQKIDYAAHCAGIVNPTPLRAITCQNMDRIIRTNFYSFAAILKCAATKKLFNDGGAVVGVSSSSVVLGDPGNGVYVASKGAMSILATSAAQELRSRRIRVNTICPCNIKTSMMTSLKFSAEFGGITGNNFPSTFLDPESVASVVIALFSESMQCISGVSIFADGALVKRLGEM